MTEPLEYYLNNHTNKCVTIPDDPKYLSKRNYLSDFDSQEEKEIVLQNLGVDVKIQELKDLLSAKIFQISGTDWDLIPTSGHNSKVLSSDALYEEFQKYYLKDQVDSLIEQFYHILLTNQEEYKSEINGIINQYETQIQQFSELINQYQNNIDNLNNTVIQPLLSKYETTLANISELRQQFNSLLQSNNSGAVFSDRLGNSSLIGVNQKTLTKIIDNFNQKFADIFGESTDITISITPDYFIDTSCNVKVSGHKYSTMFDNVKIYIDDEIVFQVNDTNDFIRYLTVDKSCNIKVEVTVLGQVITESKNVIQYYPFFIGSGLNWEDVITSENHMSQRDIIAGSYHVDVRDENTYIYIIVPKSTNISSITMSNFGVPHTIIEHERYKIYKSINTYRKGVYPIVITENEA